MKFATYPDGKNFHLAMGQNASRFATSDPELIRLLESVMGNKSAANIFWSCLIDEKVAAFEFPGIRQKAVDQPNTHDEFGGVLSHELVRGMDEFCVQEQVTRFSAVLTAFSVLMGRYADSTDFYVTHNYGVTGKPNRILKYPVSRVQLRPEDADPITFRHACVAQQELIQRSSYHLCIENLPAGPDIDVDRFLGVFLVDETSGHTREMINAGLEIAGIAMVLEILDECTVVLRLHYNKSLIGVDTAHRIYDQVLYVFERCFTDRRDCDILNIPTVPREQRMALIDQSVFGPESTKRDFPELECTLDDLIVRQAILTPDIVAVRQYEPEVVELTYAELVYKSSELSSRIKAEFSLTGSENGKIGLILDRGINQVISVLAVLMAGCAYVPIDPVNHPAERIDYILRDSSAVGIVTQNSAGAARSFSSKFPTIFVDEESSRKSPMEAPAQPNLNSADRICYVIYTSGSTGKPKGVLVPHRGIVNDIFCVYTDYLKRDASLISNVLLSTNICFDAHVDELFLPLVFGGTISVLPVNIAQADIRPEWDLSFMQSTPSVFQVIDVPDSVKCVLIGGEALTKACLERVVKPDRIVINGYGPTETTNESSLHVVKNSGDSKSIGKPLWNTQFYLLDKSGKNIVPLGAWGELYIGGTGVTKGYQNLPQLTSSVFLTNVAVAPGQTVYKTGDIVRINGDRELEFRGRKDACGQIKLRGYRIELGEIQYAIVLANPDTVKEAHVTVATINGSPQIVAYVAPKPLSPLSYGQLPEYMKPSLVIHMDQFPRNISGKLDLKKLPEPRVAACDSANSSAGLDKVTRDIIGAFRQTLSLPGEIQVSVESNFFAIGGNSLNLITLQSVLADMFHLSRDQLKLQLLIQLQTVSRISEFVQSLLGIAPGAKLPRDLLGDSVIVPLGNTLEAPKDASPFFCVHAAGGQIHTYSLLASGISENRAFYGIQDPSLNAPSGHRLNSFQALGAFYALRINDFYREGPIFIGGHSSGGSIAFETARSLEEDFGRFVACVFLIDTDCPSDPSESTENPSSEHNQVLERIDEIRHYLYNGWKEGLMLDYIKAITSDSSSSFDAKKAWHLIKAIVPRKQSQGPGWSSDLMQMISLLSHHLSIEKKYFPQRLSNGSLRHHDQVSFDVIMFRPICPGKPELDTEGGWSALTAGRYTVVNVPNANHYNIVRRPAVDVLSTVIETTLMQFDHNRTVIPRE